MNLPDTSVRMQGEAVGGLGAGAAGGGSSVVREAVAGASGHGLARCAEEPEGIHGAPVSPAGSGTSLTRSWEACIQITWRSRAPG